MQRFVTVILALLFAIGAVIYPRPAAHAQPPDDQLGESLGFVILFPQLRNLPAPTWFRAGARASYNLISANFDGGGSAGGIVQYDAVGLDAGWAIASAQNFGDNGAGALIPLGAPASKVALPAVGEYWIHPAVLVGAEAVADQSLSVTRLNKTYLGQTLQVVRFQSITQGGDASAVWEFEATGGLLMFHSRSSQNSNSAYQLTIANFRTLNLPTLGARAPNWVRPGVQMEFTGVQRQTIAGVGEVQPVSYATSLQIQGATPTWSIQAQTVSQNGMAVGPAGLTVSGVGQITGGLWLPREVLARIGQQEVIIDPQDPITGAQLRVGRANDGAIYVHEINQAYESRQFYDPNIGALNGVIQSLSTLTSITRIELSRTGGSNLAQLNSQPELINTVLQPGMTVQPDPGTNQTVRVALPNSALTLGFPADTVGEPFNVTVNTATGIPPGPTNSPAVGNPFLLLVRSNTTGGPIGTFENAASFQVQLPSAVAANNSTPVLHYHNGSTWQRLESTHNPAEGTVTASHNRSGLYAVFVVSAPVEEEPVELPLRVFLPALQRP